MTYRIKDIRNKRIPRNFKKFHGKFHGNSMERSTEKRKIPWKIPRKFRGKSMENVF